MIEISFPTRPHVKKYLEFKLGPDYVLSRSDFVGSTILDMLSQRYINTKSNNKLVTQYSIKVPNKYIKEQGMYFTPEMFFYFNKRIDQMFFEELSSHIQLNIEKPTNYCIEFYLRKMNITDKEYSIESAARRLRRRNSAMKNKNNVNVC